MYGNRVRRKTIKATFTRNEVICSYSYKIHILHKIRYHHKKNNCHKTKKINFISQPWRVFPHFIRILSKKLAKSFLQLSYIFIFYCLHVSFKILTSFWFIFFYQNLPIFKISQPFLVTKNKREYTFLKMLPNQMT